MQSGIVTSDDPLFDRDNDAINVRRHAISLARYVDLEVQLFLADDRFDYGEARFRA